MEHGVARALDRDVGVHERARPLAVRALVQRERKHRRAPVVGDASDERLADLEREEPADDLAAEAHAAHDLLSAVAVGEGEDADERITRLKVYHDTTDGGAAGKSDGRDH